MVAPNPTTHPAASESSAPVTPPPPGSLAPLNAADKKLFTLYTSTPAQDLRGFAAAAGLDLADAIHWANQPHIAAYLAFFHHHQAGSATRAGIDALTTLLDDSKDLVEKRRAATTLLRAIDAARRPSRPPRQQPQRASAEADAPQATPPRTERNPAAAPPNPAPRGTSHRITPPVPAHPLQRALRTTRRTTSLAAAAGNATRAPNLAPAFGDT